MRKFILILTLFLVSVLAFAQTTLTVAVDFTATTTEGEQFNLFEILDGGQYVCIDFFFTT